MNVCVGNPSFGGVTGDKASSQQAGSLLTTYNGAEPLKSELRPDGLCVGNPSFGGITGDKASSQQAGSLLTTCSGLDGSRALCQSLLSIDFTEFMVSPFGL